jgi:mRNA interferase HigB
MHIISRKMLLDYWSRHPDAEGALKAWHAEAKHATWTTPAVIKQLYRTSSILPDNRVVFDIKGGKYRLVVRINYPARIIFIRFIGTHREYDLIDATKI